jgi:hypothetical protein
MLKFGSEKSEAETVQTQMVQKEAAYTLEKDYFFFSSFSFK